MEKLLEVTWKLKWKQGGSWEYIMFMVAYFLLCKPTKRPTTSRMNTPCASESTRDSKNEGSPFSCTPKPYTVKRISWDCYDFPSTAPPDGEKLVEGALREPITNGLFKKRHGPAQDTIWCVSNPSLTQMYRSDYQPKFSTLHLHRLKLAQLLGHRLLELYRHVIHPEMGSFQNSTQGNFMPNHYVSHLCQSPP